MITWTLDVRTYPTSEEKIGGAFCVKYAANEPREAIAAYMAANPQHQYTYIRAYWSPEERRRCAPPACTWTSNHLRAMRQYRDGPVGPDGKPAQVATRVVVLGPGRMTIDGETVHVREPFAGWYTANGSASRAPIADAEAGAV